MEEINLEGEKISIHIEHGGGSSNNTIGLTINDIVRNSPLHKDITTIYKKYKEGNVGDISIVCDNVLIYGRGVFTKNVWRGGYQSKTLGQLKVSFVVMEYRLSKGKSILRNSKLSDILSES